MSESTYNALVVDHFTRPRNVGALDPAADVICGRAGGRAQGAQFKLTARVAEGRIVAARFEAFGCPHCVAAGSLLTSALMGQEPRALASWSWRPLAEQLQLPTAKRGRFLILEDAVHALGRDWAARQAPRF